MCIDKYMSEEYLARYMAYLRELVTECGHHGCKSRAVVELMSWDNYSVGKYCRAHGKSKLVERKLLEAGHD
jgi:UDP-glucose 6-dehydrogenase